jgi:hypothetical protein
MDVIFDRNAETVSGRPATDPLSLSGNVYNRAVDLLGRTGSMLGLFR